MFRINRRVYEEIKEAFETHIPECGGVLGASPSNPITRFYFDITGKSSTDSYTPDYLAINKVLDQWAEEDIRMVGIIHSHADDGDFPSCGELVYCERIMKAGDYDRFYLPIVTMSPFAMIPYVVEIFDGRINVQKQACIIV